MSYDRPIIVDLERYSRFAAGWDGYAGDPISPVAITAAEQLTLAVAAMNGAQRLTDIIPGPAPDGSLDIELRTEKRRLIVTIYPSSAPNGIEIRTFRTDSVTSVEKNDLGADALVADMAGSGDPDIRRRFPGDASRRR